MPTLRLRSLARAMLGASMLAGILAGAAQPAAAETFTFKMRNLYPHIIELRFYSKSRSAVWPAGGKVWKMTTRDVVNYSLSCRSGEQICFGGTSGSRSWGIGRDNVMGCKGCCYRCGNAATDVIDLAQ